VLRHSPGRAAPSPVDSIPGTDPRLPSGQRLTEKPKSEKQVSIKTKHMNRPDHGIRPDYRPLCKERAAQAKPGACLRKCSRGSDENSVVPLNGSDGTSPPETYEDRSRLWADAGTNRETHQGTVGKFSSDPAETASSSAGHQPPLESPDTTMARTYALPHEA